MDAITQAMRQHYERTFAQHGATAKGVDWNAEAEVLVRYEKMLAVTQKDFAEVPAQPTFLDAGCGFGGLLAHARKLGRSLRYTGIDLVEAMVAHGRATFPDADFIAGDIFELPPGRRFDFVVCSGILTLRLDASIVAMEAFAKRLVRKMFELCDHGIAFNMMSTRVNFMADNLYYQNPSELLSWLLAEVSPRVRLDHGYSSLASGQRRLYEYTVYVYKD